MLYCTQATKSVIECQTYRTKRNRSGTAYQIECGGDEGSSEGLYCFLCQVLL